MGYRHEEEEEEGGGSVAGQLGEELLVEGHSGEAEKAMVKRAKVVGFRTGGYEQGDFDVVSPENCPHISLRMNELSKVRPVSL